MALMNILTHITKVNNFSKQSFGELTPNKIRTQVIQWLLQSAIVEISISYDKCLLYITLYWLVCAINQINIDGKNLKQTRGL